MMAHWPQIRDSFVRLKQSVCPEVNVDPVCHAALLCNRLVRVLVDEVSSEEFVWNLSLVLGSLMNGSSAETFSLFIHEWANVNLKTFIKHIDADADERCTWSVKAAPLLFLPPLLLWGVSLGWWACCLILVRLPGSLTDTVRVRLFLLEVRDQEYTVSTE